LIDINRKQSVTTSSIARYALEKYVSDHIAKRDGTKIFIEVSTADATDEDIRISTTFSRSF